MNRPTLFAVLVLAGVTASVYGYRLSDSPIYLSPDEVVIGLDAHTLASTGRDLRGRLLPVYFQIDEFRVKGTIWYQPAIMSLTAAILQVAPLSAAAIRTPAVLIGTVNVVLLFLIARRMFRSNSAAWLAAALLALSPAHFMHSRFAMDYVYPLPFILGWLYGLTVYLDEPRPLTLSAAMLCLGLGFYSYIAAIMLMPALFIVTAWVLWRAGRLSHWRYAVAGAAAPLFAFVVWIVLHLNVFADTFQRYGLGDANRAGWVDRVGLYWRYLSPSFLFFNGGSQLMFSTRTAGVFPVVTLLLLAFGVLAGVRHAPPLRRAWRAGLLIAAGPAILLDEGSAINRAMAIVPFGVLLSVIGFEALVPRVRPGRAVAAALIVASVAQFSVFTRDYFGDYRVRSAPWFQHDIRGAMDVIIERTANGARAVYLNDAIRWADSYWKFQLTVAGRLDLLPLTRGFTHIDRDVPPGSLLLVNATDAAMAAEAGAAVSGGDFTQVRAVTEPDGTVSFIVLERRGA
ncbi:MAG: ArnT family glycosyltransferase [Acidimicrobiia bacterium]